MTVFVNGCFDVLHYGHIQLLNYARSLGDTLVVGIDSDARISEKKGKDRPFNNEFERRMLLLNLKAVDDVKVFNSDEELEDLVIWYQPDVMVVGSDWKGKPVIGSQFAKSVVYFERAYDESTTKKIESYIDRRQML